MLNESKSHFDKTFTNIDYIDKSLRKRESLINVHLKDATSH